MAFDPAMKRRRFLAIAGSLAAAAAARRAPAQELHDIAPYVARITGGKNPEPGGVDIELPQIAENGNSVPLRVKVDSPMSERDYVSAIHVVAERNPRPVVAVFHLGPWSGRAEVATRVRLAGTQNVTVVAALSDGRFRIAKAHVLVTTAACLDEASL